VKRLQCEVVFLVPLFVSFAAESLATNGALKWFVSAVVHLVPLLRGQVTEALAANATTKRFLQLVDCAPVLLYADLLSETSTALNAMEWFLSVVDSSLVLLQIAGEAETFLTNDAIERLLPLVGLLMQRLGGHVHKPPAANVALDWWILAVDGDQVNVSIASKTEPLSTDRTGKRLLPTVHQCGHRGLVGLPTGIDSSPPSP